MTGVAISREGVPVLVCETGDGSTLTSDACAPQAVVYTDVPNQDDSVNISSAANGQDNSNSVNVSNSVTVSAAVSNNVTICKDRATGKFSHYNCTEQQVPFLGDKATRKLSLEAIGYIAMGRIAELQGNYENGVLDADITERAADHVRKEVARIAKSRGEELGAWQSKFLVVHTDRPTEIGAQPSADATMEPP